LIKMNITFTIIFLGKFLPHGDKIKSKNK
jgi:hypothetical protein